MCSVFLQFRPSDTVTLLVSFKAWVLAIGLNFFFSLALLKLILDLLAANAF